MKIIHHQSATQLALSKCCFHLELGLIKAEHEAKLHKLSAGLCSASIMARQSAEDYDKGFSQSTGFIKIAHDFYVCTWKVVGNNAGKISTHYACTDNGQTGSHDLPLLYAASHPSFLVCAQPKSFVHVHRKIISLHVPQIGLR